MNVIQFCVVFFLQLNVIKYNFVFYFLHLQEVCFSQLNDI